MSDVRAGQPSVPDPEPEPAAIREPRPDRRSFLRQLSGDAVWTAGKVAGASMALRRSLVAAGEAAIGRLETAADAAPSPTEPGHASPPTPPTAPPTTTVVATTMPPAVALPDPAATLTPQQHAILMSGTRAALAVNDPLGHPLLAFSMFHWDGSVIRLPARDSTARTTNIDRDPRVSLLIDDPTSEGWVAVSGIASLLYGDRVDQEMALILAKYHDPNEVSRRWEELRSTGDQLVILVRPTRFVWRSA